MPLAPRLYLCTHERLCRSAPESRAWASTLAPLVLLPRHDALLYDPAATEATLQEAVAAVRAAWSGPWYAGFWAMNNVGRCALLPWDDDAGWSLFTRRLGWLRTAALESGCRGVLLDLELYLWTPGLGGGEMRAAYAWRDHPRIPERAEQLAAALEGLTVGGYVWAPEVRRLRGLRRWLRALYRAAGGGLLLGEDYLGGGDPALGRRLGCTYVPGVRGLKRLPRRGPVWVWDPRPE
jgi:hypothetical protein